MITYSHESADIPDIIFDGLFDAMIVWRLFVPLHILKSDNYVTSTDRSSLVCIVDVFGSAASAPGLVNRTQRHMQGVLIV